MASRPRIAIVGPGRVGGTLAMELKRAGFSLAELISPNRHASRQKAAKLARSVNARSSTPDNARLDAKVIWFCVPDPEIANAARSLATKTVWKGKIVFHSSGALTSDELEILRKQGAAVASIHPMMTFVGSVRPSLKDVPFTVEGDKTAVRMARLIVKALGGQFFPIRKRDKIAYHAWCTFSSPLLVAALAAAEQVARAAGIAPAEARKRMLPIVRQTLENYARLGAAGAFTGPVMRGDAATVRRHLLSLKKVPAARTVYVDLARSTLRLLLPRNRRELQKLLT